MLGGDGGFATARWREPASSDRLPSHRSESPTGYSSAGCSPAEPASASPVTDNSSSILIQRGNQIRCSTFTAAMQFRSRSSCPPPTGGCHLYFARRVPFLSCADNSILHPFECATLFRPLEVPASALPPSSWPSRPAPTTTPATSV